MFAGSAQNRTRSQKVSKRSEEFPQEKSALCMKKKEAQSQQSWRAAEAAAEAATQQTEATARTKTAAAGPGERERKSAKRSEKRETTTIKMRGPKKAIVRP